ncbi:MAG: flagellar M-ring protein FliF [Firmicutes bacterium]|nr:flagellar M-ring protein FliF [Bacillota bacterium]MBV1727725.1 flagellar M-ring protein FliF [Desulforudis sp.]MBU4532787.1 flagellar M-ring protein FliF [Bacillota bacterium]MBU4553677.1 flagellar M-ring protein FliF [Bacillota bacterium]MBV1736220.1 flagellar M-ring protein FliF [Desulforudis sp.]
MDGRATLSGAAEKWRGMGSTHKVAVILLAVALVVTVFYTGSYVQQANYAPLFTQVDPREAGPIIDRLDAMKVPYRLTDGGSTIQVPKNRVYEARIQLASSGALLGGGLGFELFDRTKLGITEFEQQINYQRALQEELRRTIVQLDAVEQARVHLVIPEKTIFSEEQHPPSSSIALKVRPLSELTPAQVKGIVALVSGSVEGLNPENIHVIDMRGRVLSEDIGSDSLSGVALSQQEVRRAYEKELEKRVLSLLSPVLGSNKAVAMVSAELDFRQQQSVVNIPAGDTEVTSEYELREESQGTGTGGVPGTDSNIDGPPVYSGTGGETSQSHSREERTTNYHVGTMVETTVQPPGQLKRLSTSVVVDGPVSAAVADQIQNVVSVALGLDSERGDQVLVSSMTFDTSLQQQLEEDLAAAEVAAKERERAAMIQNLIIAGALFLLLVITLVVVILTAKRRTTAHSEAQVVETKGPTDLGSVFVPGKVSLLGTVIQVSEDPEADLSPEQRDIRELAKKKPEDVAQIIKLWLADK